MRLRKTPKWFRLGIFAAIVANVLLTMPGLAQDQFSYTTNDGTITITGYTGPAGAVIIPSEINGLPVTSIAGEAFAGTWETPNTSLTSVTIPDSVVSLDEKYYSAGGSAIGPFTACTSMTNAILGESLTNIGAGAFVNCVSLTSVTIPNSVTRIGDGAFMGCTSLASIIIPPRVHFDTHLMVACRGAFEGCTAMTNAVLCNGLKRIGDFTFVGCTGLTSITLPKSVTSIGFGAFFDCSSLPSVTIPNGVAIICPGAFEQCISLTDLTIPDSVISIQSHAFSGCASLTNICIPSNVTTIGDQAFASCLSLINVTISRGVDRIGEWAFGGCDSLTHVYFEGNAPESESNLFHLCPVTVYYLPGTQGWGAEYQGRPTAPWVRPAPVILGGSVNAASNALNFRISWATNIPVVVEASEMLTNPTWSAISTNTLPEGWTNFRDPGFANHPSRFYRVRSQ